MSKPKKPTVIENFIKLNSQYRPVVVYAEQDPETKMATIVINGPEHIYFSPEDFNSFVNSLVDIQKTINKKFKS